jgi:hypothetical protein
LGADGLSVDPGAANGGLGAAGGLLDGLSVDCGVEPDTAGRGFTGEGLSVEDDFNAAGGAVGGLGAGGLGVEGGATRAGGALTTAGDTGGAGADAGATTGAGAATTSVAAAEISASFLRGTSTIIRFDGRLGAGAEPFAPASFRRSTSSMNILSSSHPTSRIRKNPGMIITNPTNWCANPSEIS